MHTVAAATFRKAVLEKAAGLASTRGFADPALLSLARAALLEDRAAGAAPGDAELAQMFPRGFPIAVVEHIVEGANRTTHQRLEECFNKIAALEAVAKNSELYRLGRYTPPNVRNVVEEAMLARFSALMPYIGHWPEAVALECIPSNIPFAAKNMVEFVDTTCYYAERMENLGAVIASGNVLLQSRLWRPLDSDRHANHPVKRDSAASSTTDEERFWHSFSSGIPLSSGPHVGEGFLGYDWYVRRTKVAAVFALGMLSLMGENANHHPETKAMIRCVTAKLF